MDELQVTPAIELKARRFYDAYCQAVGGIAFNGDPLPKSEDFFNDPAKQKQANAYRIATEEVLHDA